LDCNITACASVPPGYRQIIEVHLLFPQATPVGEAHRLATALEDHEAVHSQAH
jgi:hypothetical protein